MSENNVSKTKLYVCLGDNGDLSLNDVFEVNSVIGSAEEFEGNMPYAVVGSIEVPTEETPFLIIAKHGRSSTIYDVVVAQTEEAAKTTFLGKKRNVGRDITVKVVRDLSNLVKQYYS